MPIEILLPDTSSITSSKASSLLLYTDRDRHQHQHQETTLTRRKTLPLRRLSCWLSRRISRQGLNATYDNSHNHNPNPNHTDRNEDGDEKIISDPTRRKMRAFEADYEKEQARRTERDLAESYAAYCRAFTSAGQHHYHQKRKTWMMDGEVEMEITSGSENANQMHTHTLRVHAEDEEERVSDDERETRRIPAEPVPVPVPVLSPDVELEPQAEEPSPPPQILTPSLYAEMRRAAGDEKRTRLRQQRLWSWFPRIRHRESH